MKSLISLCVVLTLVEITPILGYFFCPTKRIVDNTFGVTNCDVDILGTPCGRGGTCCLDEEGDFSCYPRDALPPFICPKTNIVDSTPGMVGCCRENAGLVCPTGGICCPGNEGFFACYERKLAVPPTCPSPFLVDYTMGILNCDEPILGSVCSDGGLCCPASTGDLFCYLNPQTSSKPCPSPAVIDSTRNLARCKINLIGSTCYNGGTCCPDNQGDLFCFIDHIVPGCPAPLIVDNTYYDVGCYNPGGPCGNGGTCCPDLEGDLGCYVPQPTTTSRCPRPEIVDSTPGIKSCDNHRVGAFCGPGCFVCPNEQGKRFCYQHPIADPRNCPAPGVVGTTAGLPPCDVDIPGAACDDTGICCPNQHGELECFVQNPIYPELCPPPPTVFDMAGTQTCVYGVPGTLCDNGRGVCCRDQYNELLCTPL